MGWKTQFQTTGAIHNESVDHDDYHEYMCVCVYQHAFYIFTYTAMSLPVSNQSVGPHQQRNVGHGPPAKLVGMMILLLFGPLLGRSTIPYVGLAIDHP